MQQQRSNASIFKETEGFYDKTLQRKHRFLLGFFLGLTCMLSSCCHHTRWVRNKSGVYTKEDREMVFNANPSHELKLQYLGCGGIYLKNENHAIMIDPFFSNTGIPRVMLSSICKGVKIKSKPSAIKRGLKLITDKHGDDALLKETTLISAHSHYDHLMDFPYLYKNIPNKISAVYTNVSGKNILANIITNTTTMEELAADRYHTGKWITTTQNGQDTIKILPIIANHNPHFGGKQARKNRRCCAGGHKRFGIKLYNGTTFCPDPKYTEASSKSNVKDWREGQTFSFLVDIIKNGKSALRIFVQSSSCDEEYGLPPKEVLDEKSIDIALLGVASYNFSCNYPQQHIQTLNPKKVIFIHWEDFFKQYKPGKSKPVLATDVKGFFGKHYSSRITISKDNCSLPEIGVTYTVKY